MASLNTSSPIGYFIAFIYSILLFIFSIVSISQFFIPPELSIYLLIPTNFLSVCLGFWSLVNLIGIARRSKAIINSVLILIVITNIVFCFLFFNLLMSGSGTHRESIFFGIGFRFLQTPVYGTLILAVLFFLGLMSFYFLKYDQKTFTAFNNNPLLQFFSSNAARLIAISVTIIALLLDALYFFWILSINPRDLSNTWTPIFLLFYANAAGILFSVVFGLSFVIVTKIRKLTLLLIIPILYLLHIIPVLLMTGARLF